MLEIIFGRPRSGKTHRIISEIQKSVQNKRKTYLIVPEQQVFVSESMLATLDPSSWQYLQVISFTGLLELVFTKYGGLTYKKVSDGAKHLLVWHSARQTSDFLTQFAGVKIDPAFADMMLFTIDELSALGITPDDLEEKIKGANDPEFISKMKDLILIYSSYKASVEQKLGGDILLSDDLLLKLCETMSLNNFFEGADVYIDSFSDFTGIEFKILEKIIRGANKTAISLSLAGRGCDDIHTESVRDTLKRITAFARNNYIEISDVICDFQDEYIPKDLTYLEKNLWDFKITKSDFDSCDKSSISLATCKNPYEEAEYIALKILEFKNQGYKYSQMAVIPRDAESKKGIINAVFDKYSIPYFYSEKTDLSTSSAARLISAALKCVSYNFKLDDILTLVKTGLCPIEPEECDMFEDYCVTWNINGSLYKEKAWSMNPDGYSLKVSERGEKILSAANKVRDIIIPPLLTLAEKIHAANKNVKSICRAIYEYIDEVELESRLSMLCELELSLGNVREAGEILRMYDYVISSLTDLSLILGDECMSIDEVSSALEILLSHTDIGSVPAINDYVTVGSASTLRVENSKIVFIPGLVEGEFPSNVSTNGIIKASDKDILQSLGIDIPSTAQKLAADELSFAHRAISKPHDKLILTKYSFDLGGQNKSPSIVWNRALFLLPYLKNEVEVFDIERIKLIYKEELRRILQSDVKDDEDNLNIGATDIYTSSDMLSTFAENEEKEDNSTIEAIDPSLARLVLGDTIYLSKSGISTFALCPYRYWCENVLKLRESKAGSMNVADIGTYVHFVLEKLLGSEKLDDGSLPSLNKNQILSKINAISEEYIDRIGFIPSPSMLYEISRYRNIAYAMVMSVFEEFANSSFKIVSMEQSLSQKKPGALKPLNIDINVTDDFKSKIVLTGDIDRVDAYKNENGIYVRIVDYKTGTNTFSIDKVSEGNELQLPIYLFSAASKENKLNPIFNNTEGKELYAASAMFLSTKESSGKITPLRSGFILNDEEILHAASATLDSNILGVKKDKNTGDFVGNCLNEDGIASMKKILVDTVTDVARNLYSGKAERCPSQDACKYCKIRQTCPVAAKIKEY